MSLTRHLLTIFSGRLTSQIILVTTTPLLTRIFSPEDFGLVSLVSSIIQIPTILLMGRLDQAIPQSEDDQEAGQLVSLCLCWMLMIVTLCLGLSLIGGELLASLYQQRMLQPMLLAAIASLIPVALAQIGKQWAAYRERHGVTASSDVIMTLGRRLIPIPLPYLGLGGAWALFSGLMIGVGLSALNFISRLGRDISRHLDFKWGSLTTTLSKYRKYPLYLSSASLFDIAAWSGLSLLIGGYFGVNAVGWFGQAHALLFLPISLLSQSASSVFYPRLAKARENEGELRALLTRMVNLSFDLCWYPLLILLPLSPSLWGLLLGEAFATSGLLAQMLIPMGVANVIFSPVSVAYNVFHEQRALFWQSLSLNALRLGGLFGGCLYGDLRVALGAYALVTTLFRVGQLSWLLKRGGVSMRQVVRGSLVKSAYTLTIMTGVIWILQERAWSLGETSTTSLVTSLSLAFIGGLGWIGLTMYYNEDMRLALRRLLSRFSNR